MIRIVASALFIAIVVLAFQVGRLSATRPGPDLIPTVDMGIDESDLGQTQPPSERPTLVIGQLIPIATAMPTQKPKPTDKPAPITINSGSYKTTWYCAVDRSPCTVGYPASCLCAAASPDLHWRGRHVRVTYQGRSVTVVVIDCLCSRSGGLDLYAAAYQQLAPLSTGIIYVSAKVL